MDRARAIYLPPWRVDVVRRAGTSSVIADAELARAVAAALGAAGAPGPGSVTLVLTDDAELAELNAEHMGHEGPTDVLSFPMLPLDAFGAGTSGRTERGRTHIGDIAISVERALDQARSAKGGQTGDVRWSPREELRLLATHGTLHLCGRDHATPTDEAAMRALERELLRD